MANIAIMLKVGGYVVHQAAMLYCNHGFYSLSPTFFVDFYAQNGFAVGQPYRWGGKGLSNTHMDASGVVRPLAPIDHRAEYVAIGSGAVIGAYVAKKEKHRRIRWPVQRKYDNWASETLIFSRFIEDALAPVPGIIAADDRSTLTVAELYPWTRLPRPIRWAAKLARKHVPAKLRPLSRIALSPLSALESRSSNDIAFGGILSLEP